MLNKKITNPKPIEILSPGHLKNKLEQNLIELKKHNFILTPN